MSTVRWLPFVLVACACGLDESGLSVSDSGIDAPVDVAFDGQGAPDVASDITGDSPADVIVPFSPDQLSGLAAWYRADHGVTTSNNQVTGWADELGDPSKTLSQTTVPSEPSLNAADAKFNGMPTISFNHAADQFLASQWSAALPEPFTIIVIGSDDGTISNQYFLDGAVLNQAIFAQPSIYSSGYRIAVAGSPDLNSAVPDAATPRVLVGVFEPSGSLSSIFVSAKTAANTTNLGTSATLTGLTVGNCFGGAHGVGLDGSIAEILVYSRALPPGEVGLLLAYAGARYGIAIGP